MPLGVFLQDESKAPTLNDLRSADNIDYGSWADEMEDMPLPCTPPLPDLTVSKLTHRQPQIPDLVMVASAELSAAPMAQATLSAVCAEYNLVSPTNAGNRPP